MCVYVCARLCACVHVYMIKLFLCTGIRRFVYVNPPRRQPSDQKTGDSGGTESHPHILCLHPSPSANREKFSSPRRFPSLTKTKFPIRATGFRLFVSEFSIFRTNPSELKLNTYILGVISHGFLWDTWATLCVIDISMFPNVSAILNLSFHNPAYLSSSFLH